jgi:ABC-type sugar transport system ATPase subunit
VLLISSELGEVLGLAHRVIALRAGRIVGEYSGDEAQEETIMRAVFGSV